MNMTEYTRIQIEAAYEQVLRRDYASAAKILEALAKEVKAHGMAMQHGVGKPFTSPPGA